MAAHKITDSISKSSFLKAVAAVPDHNREAIATILGCGTSSVKRLAKEYGVNLSRGKDTRTGTTSLQEEEVKSALEQTGHVRKDAAGLLGCTTNTLLRAVRLYGIQLQDPVSSGKKVREEEIPVEEEHRLKQELRAVKTQLRDQLNHRVKDEDIRRLFLKASDYNLEKPKFLTPPPQKKKKERAQVVAMFSDWHFDEVVEPAEINWSNAYNREIATLRLRKYFRNLVRVCRDYINGIEIQGLNFAMLGDMLSGIIHEELIQTNDAGPLDGCLYWSKEIADGLRLLLDHFPHIYVMGIVGNHGRLDRRVRFKIRAKENYDWLLYHMISRYFLGVDEITFNIPESSDWGWPVYNTRLHATHGDQMRGGCYPGDTEFLTPSGWKRIDEYVPGDLVMQVDSSTLVGNFAEPSRYVSVPKDKFYTVKNRRVEFTTSEEHKHLLYSRRGKLITRTTQELVDKQNASTKKGNETSLVTSFLSEGGEGVDYSDEMIRVKCAVFADGSFDTNTKQDRCRVILRKERKISRMRRLLFDAGIEFNEVHQPDYNVVVFYFHLDNRDKEFDTYWFACSKQQLAIIRDEVLHWDGSVFQRPNRNVPSVSFNSTSKASINFVQYAFASGGYHTRICADIRAGRTTCYDLRISNKARGCGIQKDPRSPDSTTTIEETHKDIDRMYCFEVNSGFFVVRQKGVVYVSGNSGISGILTPISLGDHRKLKREFGIGTPYDHLMMGHFHQMLDCGRVLVNSAGKGYDEYAALHNFPFEVPQQAMFLVDPEHGKIDWRGIRVRDAKENWGIVN